MRKCFQSKLTESHPVLGQGEAEDEAGPGCYAVERRVEDEVPDQGEGGQLAGLGEEQEGRLGLQQGGDDAARVAVEQAQQVDGQRVGPADLLHPLAQGQSGGQTHHGAGGDPEHREYWGRVENSRDGLPHGEVVLVYTETGTGSLTGHMTDSLATSDKLVCQVGLVRTQL